MVKGKFSATVLCFEMGNWSDDLDKQVLSEVGGTEIIYLPAHRKNLIEWLAASLANKLFQSIWPFTKKSRFASAVSNNKRSLQLWWFLKSNKNRFKDYKLIVAHNLGALYPAYYLSELLSVPFAFDVEDYHPGEKIDHDRENEVARRKYLMQTMLPQAALVTGASPLICKEVEKLCHTKVVNINNSFFSSEFLYAGRKEMGGKVNLVWFSQHISHGRGLEVCLPVLDQLQEFISLTLIGSLNKSFEEQWLRNRLYVTVLSPMEQKALHQELATYDIGLALELRSTDFNREIALTNKIFAYLQAGLYVVATDTKAQTLLMQQYPAHGAVCEQSEKSIFGTLDNLITKICEIRDHKVNRYAAMKEISYENEGNKLLSLWTTVINESQ